MMPPSCTFDYVVTVPERYGEGSYPWAVQCRKPIESIGHHLSDDRLVGLSPEFRITEGGLAPKSAFGGSLSVNSVVSCSRLILTRASTNAPVACVSFLVPEGLTRRLQARDTIHLVRTSIGGLGISVLREGQLVVAAGAVMSLPLGHGIEVSIPRHLIRAAEAKFREVDPQFKFHELPVEIRIRDERRVMFRGWPQMGHFKVFVKHGFIPGIPGTHECIGISAIGACPEMVASGAALLLSWPNALKRER